MAKGENILTREVGKETAMSRAKNLVLLVALCLLFSATGANGGWITPAAVVDFLMLNPLKKESSLLDGGKEY